ncbi:MAG: NFACT family protein [Wujia sp.]
MALDGVVISAIKNEIEEKILGGRIYKIYQPEVDELCLVVKNRLDTGNVTERLVISADASLPLIYFTEQNKENPITAPNFCMLLRKHIGNGRIIDIRQPNFERILELTIEHLDEMGDLKRKRLIVEIMGKHSNIIFTDDEDNIIDSIKHISYQVSSVREVLPGRKYEYPPSQNKKNPLEIDVNYFMNHILTEPLPVAKAIYTRLTGISYPTAQEICHRAGIDGDMPTAAVSLLAREKLFNCYKALMDDIRNNIFSPCIFYEGYEPKEFSSIQLTMYGENELMQVEANSRGILRYASISRVIEDYYSKKSVVTRIRQRSTDLRRIVANAIERTSKKYDLQLTQLKSTEKREKYKIYGELLTAYGYSVQPGAKKIECDNYYTGEKIIIPLDPEYSAMDNSKRYFARYNKLKRTYEALTELTVESKNELDYLLSVQNSLEIATSENDLADIKKELVEAGYVRGKIDRNKGKKQEKSKPLHYISSDGYHIYVGKNNIQNEELTFKVANGNDMWFHAKGRPGSHVIVKIDENGELPDATYEEAARLAAFYSTGKDSPKVDVDYTIRKNIKKPPKAKPGYVIYHTNYSMTIEPDIHGIKEETI